jgi:hypothetical protein
VASLRRNRRAYRPPPPPPAALVEEIREVEETAEIQLETARAREPEIEDRSRKLDRIKRDNALGPRFWRAVGGH